MIIRSRAPVRISFAGGGTDVSPYTEEHGGCVLNATIRQYAWATLELRDDDRMCLQSDDLNDQIECSSRDDLRYDGRLDLLKAVVHAYPHVERGFNLYLRSDVPPRSGVGGSASAFVAVIGVFDYLLRDARQSAYEIAEAAYRLEREVLKIRGGRQDQYAAVFGGTNFIEFRGHDFVRVNPLRLRPDTLLELEKHLILIRIPGDREHSGHVIEDQVDRMRQPKSATVEALHATKRIAHEMKRALLRGELRSFGTLLDRAWQEKKRFSPFITNSRIDEYYRIAREAGALGGKLTGAGAGGHMVFSCEPNREHLVSAALAAAGATPVDLQFDTAGLQVWTTIEP